MITLYFNSTSSPVHPEPKLNGKNLGLLSSAESPRLKFEFNPPNADLHRRRITEVPVEEKIGRWRDAMTAIGS